MNNELLEALNVLEEEKNISKDTLLEAIENSLVTACKNHFGKSDNIKVNIDPVSYTHLGCSADLPHRESVRSTILWILPTMSWKNTVSQCMPMT